MPILHITTDMVTTWAVVIIGAIGYVIAARLAGKPTALAYAEAEVKRLESVCKVQDKTIADKNAYIAALEARTDIAKAMQPIVDSIREHETNAAHRSHAMLRIMDQIAATLGAEPDTAMPTS